VEAGFGRDHASSKKRTILNAFGTERKAILMLYKCVECNHEIADDAWRCPHCGTNDAGARASAAKSQYEAYEARQRQLKAEAERDKTDPGWREREEQTRIAQQEKLNAEERRLLLKNWKGALLYFGIATFLVVVTVLLTSSPLFIITPILGVSGLICAAIAVLRFRDSLLPRSRKAEDAQKRAAIVAHNIRFVCVILIACVATIVVFLIIGLFEGISW
jgi:Flp pilus assembly protein TadB